MPSDDPKFSCTACGKQYKWKPEFAGRSAKCACGAKLVVPAQPPIATPTTATTPPVAQAPKAAIAAAAPPPLPAKPPSAAAPTCPSCKAPLSPGAVLCVNCGYNVKTGKRLAAVVVETEVDEGPEAASAPAPAKSSPSPPPLPKSD